MCGDIYIKKSSLFWEKVLSQWEKALRIIPSSMLVPTESYAHLLAVPNRRCLHILGAMNSRIRVGLLLFLHVFLPKRVPLGLWHHDLLVLCLLLSSSSKSAHAPDAVTPPSLRLKIKKARASTSSPLFTSDRVVHVCSLAHPQDLESPSGVALDEVALLSLGATAPKY